VYVIKDISGSVMYFHVDKTTQRERLLVLEQKIEADLMPDVRFVTLRPM